MNNENVIKIDNLTKKIKNNLILDGISLEIEKNSVYGVIGVNGSGKSTLLRIISTLMSPTDGDITYFGGRTLPECAYISDFPGLVELFTAREFLKYTADLSGKTVSLEKIKEAIETVGLRDNKKYIKNYSRGMKQRLAIAGTLVTEPELILFDEPIAGVDLAGREKFIGVLNMLKSRCTIIIASHDLHELGKICDRAVIIDKGKIIVEGEISELTKRFGGTVFNITLSETLNEAQTAEIQTLSPKITHVKTVGRSISVFVSEFDNAVLAALTDFICKTGLTAERFNMSEARLEDIFTSEVEKL
ncbi:MAG: ABC transporter ATP-binding protein [Ruminococcus sp.]|jgi:ABC-2 type transport system ATP-binding protein|nr:ABC transporter ATP-binding protein [Ruminococcus sp.]